MNLLLDTHVFIWLSLTPERISERVTDLLMDEKTSGF